LSLVICNGASIEEGIATAAEAGCQAIAWTVRPGAHILAENVERDLRKAVELTRKAGLDTPMVNHRDGGRDGGSRRGDPQHDAGLGIRYFRAPSFRYDYAKELEPQLEAIKPRIASMAAAQSEVRHDRDVPHALGRRKHRAAVCGISGLCSSNSIANWSD
jgi:hypothetical protein